MIPKKSRGPNARFPNFAVLATITNNRRRESASHKAKKSTEKSSGAASEPPRPLPFLRLPIPIFFFTAGLSPGSPRRRPRSFAKLPGPYPAGRPSPDRRLRQRRGGIARAEEEEEPGDGDGGGGPRRG